MYAPAPVARRHPDGVRRAPARSDDELGVCAGQLRIQGRPGAVAAAIQSADPASQGRLIGQLQRQVGNGAVGALLARSAPAGEGSAPLPVQRWAVTLPAASSDCSVVADWMNANSPYQTRSGWALTSPTFGWGGDFSFSGSGKSLTVSLTNPTVSLSTTVDMPRWTPTDPAMKQAWASMSSDLRAHEARHEEVATNWQATLKSRLANLSLSVKNESDAQAAIGKVWAGWLTEHQADQSALDPFTALLDCSGGSTNSVSAAADTDDGGAAAA
jgi:predicted secreted Zn-dependent protease